MIVYEDHGGGRVSDHLREDIAGVDDRGGERTFAHDDIADLAVFVIQKHGVEELADLLRQVLAEVCIDVA
jgi:hypothetical protein